MIFRRTRLFIADYWLPLALGIMIGAVIVGVGPMVVEKVGELFGQVYTATEAALD